MKLNLTFFSNETYGKEFNYVIHCSFENFVSLGSGMSTTNPQEHNLLID